MNCFAIGQQLTSALQSATEIEEFTSLHEWFAVSDISTDAKCDQLNVAFADDSPVGDADAGPHWHFRRRSQYRGPDCCHPGGLISPDHFNRTPISEPGVPQEKSLNLCVLDEFLSEMADPRISLLDFQQSATR